MNSPRFLQAAAKRPTTEAGVLRDTLAALWIAWWRARLLGWPIDVGALLPKVSAGLSLGPGEAQRIFQRVDRIVRVVVFWKFSKRCFYRSFAAASVLRLRGLPVRLDFGLKLAGNRRKQCHCWITVGGQPLGEATDSRKLFPIPAGQWKEDVHYWLADNNAQ
jgi:hypothetical protein